MKKIDWVRKLTSRKLWLSVANFVSMMYVALGGAESEATQISALIMAGAGVIGYVIAEGLADQGGEVLGATAIQNEGTFYGYEDDLK